MKRGSAISRSTPIALVAIVAALVFSNTIGGDFLWADHTVILDKNAILHSPSDWISAFTRPLWNFTGATSEGGGGYYRPIVAASYTIDHALFGDSPAGYHVTNITLHALNSLLLLLLCSALFPRSAIPLSGALLFAVHPIHVEAVAWISGRTGLLATFGLLLSLLLFVHSRRSPWLIVMSSLAFAFALGSKESAAVLPFLILIVSRYSRKNSEGQPWKWSIPYFCILGGYLVLRFAALGGLGTGSGAALPPTVLLPTILRVLGDYLRLLFVPWPLSTNDAVLLSTSVIDLRAISSIAFIGAAVYGARRFLGDRKEVGFGLAWMGISVLPFLNLVPLLHFRAERLLYLPSIGFVIVIAAMLDKLTGKGKEIRLPFSRGAAALPYATILIVILLAMLTLSRNGDWKNDRVLFSDTISKAEYAPEAFYMLGFSAFEQGAYDQAVPLFRRALALDPRYVAFLPTPWAHTNLGYAHYRLGDFVDARTSFRNALELLPGMVKARFGFAISAAALGEHRNAIEMYRTIIGKDPGHVDGHYNLALEYEAIDSLDAARIEYSKTLSLAPEKREAAKNLGALLARMGEYKLSLEQFNYALRLDDTDPNIHFNVGLLYASTGDRERAVEALQYAIRLDSTYTDAIDLLREIGGDNIDDAGVKP